MTISELNKKIQSFNIVDEVKKIIADNEVDILETNRDQMLAGQNADGEDIRPYYSENPFFKTKEAAAGYAKWKVAISPAAPSNYPQRRPDVPNLYINGYSHSKIKYSPEDMRIYTDNSFASNVFAGHDNVLGLTPDNTRQLTETKLNPNILKSIQEAILK